MSNQDSLRDIQMNDWSVSLLLINEMTSYVCKNNHTFFDHPHILLAIIFRDVKKRKCYFGVVFSENDILTCFNESIFYKYYYISKNIFLSFNHCLFGKNILVSSDLWFWSK